MDSTPASLIEEFQHRGLRLTPQRAIIFEAIEKQGGHFTAEDVFQNVKQVNPYVSLATVYRTLELLSELKLINQTNFGRSQSYFASKDHGPHHHLVCTECGVLEEFDDALLDSLRADLREKHHFKAQTDHICIFGICRNCTPK